MDNYIRIDQATQLLSKHDISFDALPRSSALLIYGSFSLSSEGSASSFVQNCRQTYGLCSYYIRYNFSHSSFVGNVKRHFYTFHCWLDYDKKNLDISFSDFLKLISCINSLSKAEQPSKMILI